ncbi:MAG: RluA family pseudouridine synthase [Gemmatimonadales bacterium]
MAPGARLPAVAFSATDPAPQRLDRFLADQLDLSRTQAARLIADQRVRIGGKVARASRLVARGELVEVELPETRPLCQLQPAAAGLPPIPIVYEDDHLAVVNKPAGLVVHPAPGHWDDTLLHALRARGTRLSTGPAPERAGIVHRLDRDTSGLLLIAKTDLAHRRLGTALAARLIRRAYAALTWGHFDRDRLTIEAPIGRHPVDRKRMAIRPEGRAARTDLTVIARLAVCDLVRADLQSGRTHQIRVHVSSAGHPVVGDPVYGQGGARRVSGALRPAAERLEKATPRQALHAAWLEFAHPATGDLLAFRAEWPQDLAPALAQVLPDSVDPATALTYLGFFGPVSDG